MDQMTIFDYENKQEIPLMKWIPCKEKLPEHEGWYIVTEWSLEERDWDVTMDKWRFKNGQGEWAFSLMEKVLAWMPMPEIYEEVNK